MLNQSRLRRPGAAALAAVLVAAGCSSSGGAAGPPAGNTTAASSAAAAFPVTVHGAAGDVTIRRQPTAIVSLSPTLTEMLFAIGAGDEVKAVDKNSDYPADAPHTGLDAYQLNAESVAAYHPDLVVASGLQPAQAKQLNKLQIPTLDEPAATNLRDTYNEITALGKATGHADGATSTIASMKQKIASIVKTVKQPAGGASYYYELDQTYYSVLTSTFIGQVLKLLGLHSIADSANGAAASGGYPQLSAEFILNANPDYVFLADTKCCKQTPAKVAARPGWSTLDAVKGSRVIPLDDDIASRWGPRIVDLLQVVATAIKQHPVSP